MMKINWKEIMWLAANGNSKPPTRVEKTKEEWKSILSDEQFSVTREHGTERAFSGEFCESFTEGKYACVCCETLLFDASSKFESGTGWPSFTEPVEINVIKYILDRQFGMTRVETLCNICDAHLGHVFPDGPAGSSGLRFCMNSVALKKV